MEIPKIEDIRVYSPALDGIDYKTFVKIGEDLAKIERTAAVQTASVLITEALYNRVLKTKVFGQTTLEEFLNGPLGYFARNPKVRQVLFMNGAFVDSVESGQLRIDEVSVGEKTNAVPFVFNRPVNGDYF